MRLYQVTWEKEIAPYQANHRLKSTLYGWFFYDYAEHFFPYTHYQQKVLKKSWLLTEEDIGSIKSIYFTLEYIKDLNETPNGFVISGQAKDLTHVRELFKKPVINSKGLSKDELVEAGFVAVHFNPDRLYTDRILPLHVTTVAKIIEIGEGDGKRMIKIWVPFSISALDVIKKLKLIRTKIEGVSYVQKK